MERLENLNLQNLKIYQDDSLYKFTSDSVLLSKFAKVKKGDVVADFCAGSGIVGFHLFGLNANLIESLTFFEMQEPLYLLNKKSIQINGLEQKFFSVNTAVQDIDNSYSGKFSLIVCNPPYGKCNSGQMQEDESIAMCRYELYLPLEELIKSVSKCLKFGGRVALCHRADRLADIFYCMKQFNIEPKRLQTISAHNKEPYLVLVEGVKGGKSGLKILTNGEN